MKSNVPVYVLGFGSNLLVADEGVRGAVVQLKTDSFSQMNFDKESVTAGAGRLELGRLLFTCARKGLSGLEPLSGIPGSVGGRSG